MTKSDDAIQGPFYHGTRAALETGDLIAAGYSSNYGQRKTASWVYLSATWKRRSGAPSWRLAMVGSGSIS